MKRRTPDVHYGGVRTAPDRPELAKTLRWTGPPDRVTAVFGRYLLTGDEEALDEVVRDARPRLLAAARRIGNPDDAEDAVQAAFLSLIRHRGAPFDAPVMPWLLTAVVRTAYRRKAVARREARIAERLALSSDAGPGAPSIGGDGVEGADVTRLRAEVARLPDRYRDPVILHHLQGLSTAETARLLDVPEPTVRTRLRRARLLVRTRWNPRTTAAFLALPWLLADLGRVGATPSTTATSLVTGGLMTVSTALPVAIVVALGVGALLGRTLLAPNAPEADTSMAATASTARIAELESKIKSLEKQVGDANQLAAQPKPIAVPTTSGTAARATPPEPATAPSPDKPVPVEARQSAAIAIPGFDKALDTVDWAEVGKNLHAMPPALTKFVAEWVKTGKVPIELAGKVQSYNGPLVTAAGALSTALKIDNPNVAFTHPAFQANAIAAALEVAGHPLDDAQKAAIAKLVTQAIDDEAGRAANYDERTLEVSKLIDRADVRDRFFDGVRALLSASQLPVLGSEEWRGRVISDLYSSGLIWQTVAQGIPTTDREAMVAKFAPIYAGQFEIPAASAVEFTALVSEWAREIPDDFFKREPDPRDAVGAVPVSLVIDFARRQATLETRTIERMKLDDAAIQKVRSVGFVIFPIRVAAKADGPK